ncbi:uncharacterized protein LOC134830281 isoform X2 [Culicoides brevitarsis]|uniref:uncharacterized protein LOC134830281 isoform X2 n=1 Tax=Culicoides brevitarsis TaxID=469753 RepID=UPI00307C8E1C
MESSENFVPPPPPPPKGPIPTKRLDTQIPAEAPACVQNAMMTKDKKPFTYTPGGIDLSQIKSPRMAKRVQKNALSEGVTGPPKVSPLAKQCPTQVANATAPAMCMAKDIAGMPFQVFPSGPPAPPPMPMKQSPSQKKEDESDNKAHKQSSIMQQHFEAPPIGLRPEIKIPQNPMANLKPTPRHQQIDEFWTDDKCDKSADSSINLVKADLELAKEDTHKNMSLHEKKGQLGQLYIPKISEMDRQQLMHQQSPPWMSSSKYQTSGSTPEWVNSNESDRRVPIEVENSSTRTPSLKPMTPNLCPQPFYGSNKKHLDAATVINAFEPTFTINNGDLQHQGYQNIDFQKHQFSSPNTGVSHIIPIKLEGYTTPMSSPDLHRNSATKSQIVVQRGNVKFFVYDVPLRAHINFIKQHLSDPRQQSLPTQWTNNTGGTPTQSRSFRVLQKMTDAYANPDLNESVPIEFQQEQYSKPMSPTGVDSNMRRIKLDDGDKLFMNRVRNQVDDELYLHKEENPRYRGSAIPSKAFKLLQTMTNSNDSGDEMGSTFHQTKLGNSKSETEEDYDRQKPYVHPSEQQVFEPKKYTGANIPSRSFRLLQAMTQADAGTGVSDL